MDTRQKIIPAAAAAERIADWRRRGGVVRVVTGYFDVLLADHVRQLRDLAANEDARAVVVVVLLQPCNPILSPTARAELVAALAMVDYVVIAAGHDELVTVLTAADTDIRRMEAHDAERIRQLIEHVHQRQLRQAG